MTIITAIAARLFGVTNSLPKIAANISVIIALVALWSVMGSYIEYPY